MKREELINKITNNLGVVSETEDAIICKVDINKVKKIDNRYLITCMGIREEDLELAIEYGLNKRIVYVFEGIEIATKKLQIKGISACDIVIKNSKIDADSLYIMLNNGNVTIEDTIVRNLSIHSTINASNLILKNTYMASKSDSKSFYLAISASKYLGIKNSKLDMPKANIDIIPEKELSIIESIIVGNFKVCNIEPKELNIENGICNISTFDLLSLRLRLLSTLNAIGKNAEQVIQNNVPLKKALTK